MTSKEARDHLICGRINCLNNADEDEKLRDLCIRSLEKQNPKKVAFTVDRTWGIESKQPVCPVCDYYLTKTEFFGDGEKITYCEHCGNAIDWEDKE